MKKVVLSLAVLFSVAMVACNGNKKAEAVDTLADTVVTEEVAVATDSQGDTAVVAEAAVETEAPADSAK